VNSGWRLAKASKFLKEKGALHFGKMELFAIIYVFH